MANDAANMQLSIVARPKMVWPGLDKAGRTLTPIAGDGNCLFASLSHQLYGVPDYHMQIRATIVQHMRDFRPLYEAFVQVEDVIQKRSTRAAANALRVQSQVDAYEGYLTTMARFGSYGGQPELQAFVRAYNQDVMVHLPHWSGYKDSTMSYTHAERDSGTKPSAPLHICYGGDEVKAAHYDSSQTTVSEQITSRPLTSRPKITIPKMTLIDNCQANEDNNGVSPRAIRGMKGDPQCDMMHELVTSKGSRSLRAALEDRRARSPSVSSSQYSTGSKRSIDDVDGVPSRATKRTDRKKRSLRQTAAEKLSQSPRLTVPMPASQPASSGPPTPTSSQGTGCSEQSEEQPQPMSRKRSHEVIEIDDSDDDLPLPARRSRSPLPPISTIVRNLTAARNLAMEQPSRTTLRL